MLLRASPAPDSASNDPRLAKLHSSHPPARLPAIPDGQSALIFCFLPRQTKIRRANSEALLPRRGKQRRLRTPAAPPCPRGARQRRPTHTFAGGRPLLVGLPPSAPAAAPSEPKRSAPAPCSWGGCASTRSRRRWKPAPPARLPGRPLAPAEQGNAAPALKTLACRLFFPLICAFPLSCGKIHNRDASAFPFAFLRKRNALSGKKTAIPPPTASQFSCIFARISLANPQIY